jgi:hypothetical protein
MSDLVKMLEQIDSVWAKKSINAINRAAVRRQRDVNIIESQRKEIESLKKDRKHDQRNAAMSQRESVNLLDRIGELESEAEKWLQRAATNGRRAEKAEADLAAMRKSLQDLSGISGKQDVSEFCERADEIVESVTKTRRRVPGAQRTMTEVEAPKSCETCDWYDRDGLVSCVVFVGDCDGESKWKPKSDVCPTCGGWSARLRQVCPECDSKKEQN